MRTRTALPGIGGAIALTIGGGTAYAAIAGGPVDASGVVHGCYTNQALCRRPEHPPGMPRQAGGPFEPGHAATAA